MQALEFALKYFNKTYVVYTLSQMSTFHPKIYLFQGERKAVCYIGSHNLTVGGTETNFEGGVKIEIELPKEENILQEVLFGWETLLPIAIELDEKLLQKLIQKELIFDEKRKSRKQKAVSPPSEEERSDSESDELEMRFSEIKVKPPSSIPSSTFKTKAKKRKVALPTKEKVSEEVPVQALVIQIVPHKNGEVFLSKRAIDQNPEFFGFPFTGWTIPKKAKNPSYPQREPDPVVNITVYNSTGEQILKVRNFNLNTVYYEKKSEIRITVSQDVVTSTPSYSILVMKQAPKEQSYDYALEIYVPGSQDYDEYLKVCNQTLPSGGAGQARRMGWL